MLLAGETMYICTEAKSALAPNHRVQLALLCRTDGSLKGSKLSWGFLSSICKALHVGHFAEALGRAIAA